MTDIYYTKKEGLIKQKWGPAQKVKSIIFEDESSALEKYVRMKIELEDGTKLVVG